MTAMFKENAADIEAKFLRHVYDPNCFDCQVDEYPCADHRAACTNCGAEASVPGELHKSKFDRRGAPLRIWWCAKCNGPAEPEPRDLDTRDIEPFERGERFK